MEQRRVQSVTRTIRAVPQVLDTFGKIQEFADQGWASATEQIGRQGWTRLKRKWRTPKCESLAAAADTCDRFHRSLATTSQLDDLKYMPAVGVLVRQFNPLEVHARQLAALLRAIGVAICAVNGTLRECACLKAMINIYGDAPALISTALRQATQPLA